MRIPSAAPTMAFALLCAACGPRSTLKPEGAVSFQGYRRIGVPAFIDKTGRGQEIADALDAGFQKAFFDPVDQKALAQMLAQYKPDNDMGFSVEALEMIRRKTGVDALVYGRMTPDWAAVVVTMVEMHTGDVILRGILRPRGYKKKAFSNPDEVADEFLRRYLKLH